MCSLIPKNYNVLYISLYLAVDVCFYPLENCRGVATVVPFYDVPISLLPLSDQVIRDSVACRTHESYSRTCDPSSCDNYW